MSAPGSTFTTRHAVALVFLTLTWGFNWPVMKVGASGLPPLGFRALSMWLGLPIMLLVLWRTRLPWRVPRQHWRELALLTVTNLLFWHVLAILAVSVLSSGRAAILGYTMPIFSVLWGLAVFGERPAGRQWLGVGAAALGVVLLLWHEFGHMSGKPLAAVGMLVAAAAWALGTQQLRRTRIPLPTFTIAFWMTVITTVAMTLLTLLFERPRWTAPGGLVWGAILYNAVLIFGFAQPAWFFLARTLPPLASTLSVMLIPVLGTFSGAWLLGEQLLWQDWTAMVLMVVAIAAALSAPARRPAATTPVMAE